MKKNILFIALTLLVLTSNAQEYKEYYNNGNTKVIGTKKNNLETGNWKYYFENGKISKTGNYLEGKLHGEWKYYHENGKQQHRGASQGTSRLHESQPAEEG